MDGNGCKASAGNSFQVIVTDCRSTCLAPENLRVSNITGSQANLSWTAPNQGAVCYLVSYGPLSVDPALWQTELVPASGNNYTLQNLIAGLSYGVKMTSNCSGCSLRGGTLSQPSDQAIFTTANFKSEASNFTHDVRLYPNPNKGVFTLQLDGMDIRDMTDIQVFDAKGSRMEYNRIDLPGNQVTTLELINPISGIYIVQFRVDSIMKTLRVVVE